MPSRSLRPLRESLAGDRVTPRARHRQRHHQLHPRPDGRDRRRASPRRSAEAQALGYAEADPTADVEGFDAAAKAAILAALAFHTRVTIDDVHREGITEVTADDIASAARDGLRHQAAGDRRARRRAGRRDGVCVRVHPAMVPRSHPLAGVRERVQRGVRRERGRRPADVLRPRRRRAPDRQRGARRPRRGRPQPGPGGAGAGRVDLRRRCRSLPIGDAVTRYHICLDVADQPGVLAAVAAAFAEHGVSIADRAPGGPTATTPQLRHRHPPGHRRRAGRDRRRRLRDAATSVRRRHVASCGSREPHEPTHGAPTSGAA